LPVIEPSTDTHWRGNGMALSLRTCGWVGQAKLGSRRAGSVCIQAWNGIQRLRRVVGPRHGASTAHHGEKPYRNKIAHALHLWTSVAADGSTVVSTRLRASKPRKNQRPVLLRETKAGHPGRALRKP